MKYNRPCIMIVEADFGLLIDSGPGAGDIGSPSVRYNSKSIWDEESDKTLFNIKEEQDYNAV